eukprot:UN03176
MDSNVLDATNPERVVLSCGVNDILFTQSVEGTVASLQNVWNILDEHPSGFINFLIIHFISFSLFESSKWFT